MYAPRGGSSPLYISIAYYMQKGGEGVQIACKIVYVLNGRPLNDTIDNNRIVIFAITKMAIFSHNGL